MNCLFCDSPLMPKVNWFLQVHTDKEDINKLTVLTWKTRSVSQLQRRTTTTIELEYGWSANAVLAGGDRAVDARQHFLTHAFSLRRPTEEPWCLEHTVPQRLSKSISSQHLVIDAVEACAGPWIIFRASCLENVHIPCHWSIYSTCRLCHIHKLIL